MLLCGTLSMAVLLCLAHKPVHAEPSQSPAPAPLLAPDASDRSKAILDHLNAVLRFYRDTSAPIQKVGEPSDLIYRDQAVTLAVQIGGFAFQSAKAEAALMQQTSSNNQASSASGNQAQHFQQIYARIQQQIATLKTQDSTLARQIESAPARHKAAIEQQRKQVAGQLELQTAMGEAIGKIAGMAGASNDNSFGAQIDRLQRSAPGLAAGKPITVVPELESLSEAQSSGVTSQARVLFQLLGAKEDIDKLLNEVTSLHQQALALRTPLISLLKNTMAQGQALSQASTPPPSTGKPTAEKAAPTPSATAQNAPTQDSYDQLAARFKSISQASVPLSQEILTLEQSQAGLQAWRNAVNAEYISILRSLLLRVLAIAIALAIVFILGQVWSRATRRYVHDIRRRRQLLLIRRLIVGFLSGLVLIFGLVTQFSSLATFAGFLTAGIAVGLQTILLSVAAYFFIIGRYGVKVGDRITIAGVTGDVVEVGLVRFYIMELAGSGTDLYPTGRIAVFSNAVLFQAATPLYKQMPGTEYAWHELSIKLAPESEYQPAVQQILKSIQDVYNAYSHQIEQQHRHLESWMDSSLDMPGIRSNVQFTDGSLQLLARFPVMIRESASIDEKMTESLLKLIATDPGVKTAVSAPPTIKAAVKG
jgi:small-conductance mechanosensitive channel